MKIEEGPSFSAVIVGGGVGFLLFRKTQQLPLSIAVGLAAAIIDYTLIVFVKKISKKRK